MDRDALAALVPGGVPDASARHALVADLIELTGEMPEVDTDAQSELVLKAARAIFADGLLLDPQREMPLVDRYILKMRDLMDRAERATRDATGRPLPGMKSPEFYSGAIEGLQLLRTELIGSPLDGPRNA